MNVLFHTTAAFGVAVMLLEDKTKPPTTLQVVGSSALAFALGVISHGALDYMPHCYPVNSKLDAIMSVMLMAFLMYRSAKGHRPILAAALLGGVLPDLIDLGPAIANKYAGLNLPILDKIFPWHWEKYSGSIFTDDCAVSTLNHLLLVFTVVVFCWKKGRSVLRV